MKMMTFGLNRRLSITKCLVTLAAFSFCIGNAQAQTAKQPTYSPRSKQLEVAQGSSGNYKLTISPPADPNKNQKQALQTNSIAVTINVSPTDCPQYPETCPMLVTSIGESHMFGFGSADYTVNVDVPAATVVGTYTYKLKALGGALWPVGEGATLVVVVGAPTPSDSTPPLVTINSPSATSNNAFIYCAGGTSVDVDIEATDAESVISNIWALLDGAATSLTATYPATPGKATLTGTLVVNSIGEYAVDAYATSLGGTTGPVDEKFTVKYTVGLTTPTTKKLNAAFPIRFSVLDCNGASLNDANVTATIFDADAHVVQSLITEIKGTGTVSDPYVYKTDDFEAPSVGSYNLVISFKDQKSLPFVNTTVSLIVN